MTTPEYDADAWLCAEDRETLAEAKRRIEAAELQKVGAA